MNLSVISFKIRESVAVITLNNSPVNALTPEFLEDFEKVTTTIKGNKNNV